jgi:lipoyl(octanoyl) transferase
MIVIDLGLIEFHEALAIQRRLNEEVAAGIMDETLLLLEHPPVYTIGSGGELDNLLDMEVEVIRTNRGGDITYHGPGQLVAYPIINLASRGRDLHRYLRFIEELIIRTIADFGIAGFRSPGRTGVWCGVDPYLSKVASIGIGVRRWVTMHGFSINVDMEIEPFERIVPCGIKGCRITTLSSQLGETIPVGRVAEQIGMRFEMLAGRLIPATFGDIIISG